MAEAAPPATARPMSTREAGFALGTFHVVVLVLAGVLVVHASDGLGGALEDLDTGFGLALFAFLWWVSVFVTRRALARFAVEGVVASHAFRDGIVWGAVAGVLILLPGVIAVAALGLVRSEQPVEGVLVMAGVIAIYGGIGSAIAAMVGAAFGFVFAVLDLCLLLLAGLAIRPDRSSETPEADLRSS